MILNVGFSVDRAMSCLARRFKWILQISCSSILKWLIECNEISATSLSALCVNLGDLCVKIFGDLPLD